MVSILPSERTPLEVIDKIVGQRIAENLPQAINQGYQRQLGLNALEQANLDIQGANGDPYKIALAFAKAGAQNPNLERALGPLIQTAMTQGQRGKGANDFPVGGKKTASGVPIKENTEIPVSVSDLVKARNSFVQDPQGVSNFQLPYGPEEIAQIRQQARQKGYLPEAEERFVNDALEYNKIAQTKRDIDIQNYNQAQQQRRDTIENQKAFETYLREHSPELANNPDELELALKASEKYQGEKSFAERNAKVRAELRPYQQAKKAMDKVLDRPLFGMDKEQVDLARKRAKMMVEMGQKDQLRLKIAKGGNGEVEEAYLLNPLPKDIENDLVKGFPNFVDPYSDEHKNKDTDFLKEKLANQQKRLVEYLSDHIQPGTYEEPGTNLLLVRKYIMDKGATYAQSAKIIDEAIASGSIKLDPHQKIDYQKLAYPPLKGDDYLDTLLNNLLFPITGKQ